MRESFAEYKKNIENVLETINYLYSGDVLNSIEREFVELKNTPLTSPNFIVNSIIHIYNESFEEMKNKCIEIILAKESILPSQNILDYILPKIPFKPVFIFCSEQNKKLFGRSKNLSSIGNFDNHVFPQYFYLHERIIGLSIDSYSSPLVDDNDSEIVLYLTDAPIQSLVYTLQNMDYSILPTDETNKLWEHKIFYNFYNCQYKSCRVILRNLSRIRESKIKDLLNGD